MGFRHLHSKYALAIHGDNRRCTMHLSIMIGFVLAQMRAVCGDPLACDQLSTSRCRCFVTATMLGENLLFRKAYKAQRDLAILLNTSL